MPIHPSRRSSAAAARRLRGEIAARTARPLSRQRQDLLDAFSPRPPLRAAWSDVRPVVREVLALSEFDGEDSFRKHLTHLGYFFLWARERDLPLTVSTLTRLNVDEYARTGMAGSTDKSRADRRARLRCLVDRVNPPATPHRGVGVARPVIKAPYSGAELQQLVRAAENQPTGELTRKASVCLGLGAGAGLDSQDLRLLRRRHVNVTSWGTLVSVPGARQRCVPVLPAMEHLVHAGIRAVAEDDLLLGRVETRRNVAAGAVEDLVLLGGCPPLEQSRLRSTWLAHQLAAGVPLHVLLPAAGLQTARTLPDLLPHLPEVPPEEARALLRSGWGAA